jgi:hypothetical protein
MMRDEGPARAIPAGFHVGQFATTAFSVGRDKVARAAATSNQALSWYLRRSVSRTGMLIVVALGALAGMAVGQLETFGSPPGHTIAQAQRMEVTSITVTPANAAEPLLPSVPPLVVVAPREALASGAIALKELPQAATPAPVQAIAPKSNRAVDMSIDASAGSMTPRAIASVEPTKPAARAVVKPGRASDTAALRVAALTPQERARNERMIARGQHLLDDGSVSQAREFFLRAAEAGLAKGAFLLASTYDARELSRLGVMGVQPNAALARTWYQRARQLGTAEAVRG